MSWEALSNDELVVINRLFKGEDREFYDKAKCLEDIGFVIVTHEDEEILSLYKELYEKVKGLNTEDWAELLRRIPFDLTNEELGFL